MSNTIMNGDIPRIRDALIGFGSFRGDNYMRAILAGIGGRAPMFRLMILVLLEDIDAARPPSTAFFSSAEARSHRGRQNARLRDMGALSLFAWASAYIRRRLVFDSAWIPGDLVLLQGYMTYLANLLVVESRLRRNDAGPSRREIGNAYHTAMTNQINAIMAAPNGDLEFVSLGAGLPGARGRAHSDLWNVQFHDLFIGIRQIDPGTLHLPLELVAAALTIDNLRTLSIHCDRFLPHEYALRLEMYTNLVDIEYRGRPTDRLVGSLGLGFPREFPLSCRTLRFNNVAVNTRLMLHPLAVYNRRGRRNRHIETVVFQNMYSSEENYLPARMTGAQLTQLLTRVAPEVINLYLIRVEVPAPRTFYHPGVVEHVSLTDPTLSDEWTRALARRNIDPRLVSAPIETIWGVGNPMLHGAGFGSQPMWSMYVQLSPRLRSITMTNVYRARWLDPFTEPSVKVRHWNKTIKQQEGLGSDFARRNIEDVSLQTEYCMDHHIAAFLRNTLFHSDGQTLVNGSRTVTRLTLSGGNLFDTVLIEPLHPTYRGQAEFVTNLYQGLDDGGIIHYRQSFSESITRWVPMLQSLTLKNLGSLDSIDDDAFRNLTNMRTLSIVNCPNVDHGTTGETHFLITLLDANPELDLSSWIGAGDVVDGTSGTANFRASVNQALRQWNAINQIYEARMAAGEPEEQPRELDPEMERRHAARRTAIERRRAQLEIDQASALAFLPPGFSTILTNPAEWRWLAGPGVHHRRYADAVSWFTRVVHQQFQSPAVMQFSMNTDASWFTPDVRIPLSVPGGYGGVDPHRLVHSVIGSCTANNPAHAVTGFGWSRGARTVTIQTLDEGEQPVFCWPTELNVVLDNPALRTRVLPDGRVFRREGIFDGVDIAAGRIIQLSADPPRYQYDIPLHDMMCILGAQVISAMVTLPEAARAALTDADDGEMVYTGREWEYTTGQAVTRGFLPALGEDEEGPVADTEYLFDLRVRVWEIIINLRTMYTDSSQVYRAAVDNDMCMYYMIRSAISIFLAQYPDALINDDAVEEEEEDTGGVAPMEVEEEEGKAKKAAAMPKFGSRAVAMPDFGGRARGEDEGEDEDSSSSIPVAAPFEFELFITNFLDWLDGLDQDPRSVNGWLFNERTTDDDATSQSFSPAPITAIAPVPVEGGAYVVTENVEFPVPLSTLLFSEVMRNRRVIVGELEDETVERMDTRNALSIHMDQLTLNRLVERSDTLQRRRANRAGALMAPLVLEPDAAAITDLTHFFAVIQDAVTPDDEDEDDDEDDDDDEESREKDVLRAVAAEEAAEAEARAPSAVRRRQRNQAKRAADEESLIRRAAGDDEDMDLVARRFVTGAAPKVKRGRVEVSSLASVSLDITSIQEYNDQMTALFERLSSAILIVESSIQFTERELLATQATRTEVYETWDQLAVSIATFTDRLERRWETVQRNRPNRNADIDNSIRRDYNDTLVQLTRVYEDILTRRGPAPPPRGIEAAMKCAVCYADTESMCASCETAYCSEAHMIKDSMNHASHVGCPAASVPDTVVRAPVSGRVLSVDTKAGTITVFSKDATLVCDMPKKFLASRVCPGLRMTKDITIIGITVD